jgi:hypothetical protein
MKRLFVLLCLLPAGVQAQEAILNPQKAQFTASADHATITRYELRHFVVGQTAPAQVYNLGKPTPDGTNTITATFPALPRDPAKQYVAKVVAIGPQGEGASTDSNPYLFAEGVQLALPQKVKLTLTAYDGVGNPLPPLATISGWSVEGASAANVLGTFETIPLPGGGYEPLAVFFLPAKVGVFRVQGSFVVGGIPFAAWTTVVVTTVPQ